MFNTGKSTTASRKLHSIHVLQDDKNFSGKIETGRIGYKFTFSPSSAAIDDGKLVLTGVVTVKAPAGASRKVENVRATCMASQGNIQNAPAKPASIGASLKHPLPAQQADKPLTDATDNLSSAGVIYFKLSKLDGRALGVALDMSSVQLNARLNPKSQTERDLQWLYSAITAADNPKPYLDGLSLMLGK